MSTKRKYFCHLCRQATAYYTSIISTWGHPSFISLSLCIGRKSRDSERRSCQSGCFHRVGLLCPDRLERYICSESHTYPPAAAGLWVWASAEEGWGYSEPGCLSPGKTRAFTLFDWWYGRRRLDPSDAFRQKPVTLGSKRSDWSVYIFCKHMVQMPIRDHGCVVNGIFILLPFGTCYGGLPIEITVACIMHTNGKRHLIRILSGFYESEQFCCNWWCDSSLCFCSQDETQHLPPHGGPVHERGEEEEERTGIHSLCRSAEDGARTQIEVDQVGGVKTYRHPDHNLVLWIWCSKDRWSWNTTQNIDRHLLYTLQVLHKRKSENHHQRQQKDIAACWYCWQSLSWTAYDRVSPH